MDPSQGLDSLRDAIAGVVDETQVPGIAVAVVSGGEPVFVEGFGSRDARHGGAVTPRTIFHTASVTKTFVAAAVVILAERGLIDLEDPVVTHVNEFRTRDGLASDITLEQLLTHTSGLPDVRDYRWYLASRGERAIEREVGRLRRVSLRFRPGTDIAYSNLGYTVLGEVIARVTGRPFETAMRELLLHPLGMDASQFDPYGEQGEGRAEPHRYNAVTGRVTPSRVYPYHRAHAPSSTLHATAEDMSRWMIALLGNGRIGAVQVMPPDVTDVMWSPYTQVPGGSVGYSWFQSTMDGVTVYSHSGRDVGFRSLLIVAPDLDAGVAVLANADVAPVDEIAARALAALQGRRVSPIAGVRHGYGDPLMSHGVYLTLVAVTFAALLAAVAWLAHRRRWLAVLLVSLAGGVVCSLVWVYVLTEWWLIGLVVFAAALVAVTGLHERRSPR